MYIVQNKIPNPWKVQVEFMNSPKQNNHFKEL